MAFSVFLMAQLLQYAAVLMTMIVLLTVVHLKRAYKNAKLIWILKRHSGKQVVATLPIPVPCTITGEGSIHQVGDVIKELKCRKPLVVADEMLVKLGVVKKCTHSLDAKGLKYEVFTKVTPDPVSELVEAGYTIYTEGSCDAIIAIGGGSPMDVAKAIGARVANPTLTVLELAGHGKMTTVNFPPLVAVPTTAGSGSETTLVAVITDSQTTRKVFLLEPALVPKVAILDSELLVTLPKAVSAAAGMDALTHAIESYISGWATHSTRERSLAAAADVLNNLVSSYNKGDDLLARQKMLLASFNAGVAGTRANIGYVHNIAHQLGALFHISHGDANAMLLPHVLSFYIQSESQCADMPCCKRLSEVAKAAGIVSDFDLSANSLQRTARMLVNYIVQMNTAMNIPSTVSSMKGSDVSVVAKRALAEAHGNGRGFGLAYFLDAGSPVPVYMTLEDCEAIVRKCVSSEGRGVTASSMSPCTTRRSCNRTMSGRLIDSSFCM